MARKSRSKKDFVAWAEKWLSLVKPTVKGNTFAAGYRNPVEKHIIPHFEGRKLTEIRHSDIQSYINLKAETYSLDTVKKHKSCLCQIFDAAINDDLCVKNPVKQIKIPDTKKRAEKLIYTPEQAQQIFNFGYTHRFGAEVQFMLATGVSRGELLAIRWSDVDLGNRTVQIRQGAALVPNAKTGKQETVIGEPKNDYRKRILPISHEVVRILEEIPHESAFVFYNVKGNICNPRTWSRRHYAVFMEDMKNFYAQKGIEIPIYPSHQLRHTRLSLWINENKSPIAVAKFGGHANMDMLLKRYAHSNAEELRDLLDIG